MVGKRSPRRSVSVVIVRIIFVQSLLAAVAGIAGTGELLVL
jgi:hypothetical protein